MHYLSKTRLKFTSGDLLTGPQSLIKCAILPTRVYLRQTHDAALYKLTDLSVLAHSQPPVFTSPDLPHISSSILKSSLLRLFWHAGSTWGHPGIVSMLRLLRQAVWWPYLRHHQVCSVLFYGICTCHTEEQPTSNVVKTYPRQGVATCSSWLQRTDSGKWEDLLLPCDDRFIK